jgi:uncharacterized protein YndB with AHSA1/START domain
MADHIERELLVPASVSAVWEVVTSDGWLAEEVELDPVPGGDAHFRSRDAERQGWVEEAQPHERLVFWWSVDGEPASRVELTLEPTDEGTRVRVAETRPLDVLDVVGIPLPGSGGPSYGPALLAAA